MTSCYPMHQTSYAPWTQLWWSLQWPHLRSQSLNKSVAEIQEGVLTQLVRATVAVSEEQSRCYWRGFPKITNTGMVCSCVISQEALQQKYHYYQSVSPNPVVSVSCGQMIGVVINPEGSQGDLQGSPSGQKRVHGPPTCASKNTSQEQTRISEVIKSYGKLTILHSKLHLCLIQGAHWRNITKF